MKHYIAFSANNYIFDQKSIFAKFDALSTGDKISIDW